MTTPTLKASTSRLGLLLLLLTSILALAGCASGGGGAPAMPAGPSDEELVTEVIQSALAALEAKDIDKMMMAYADDFTSDNGDKAATKEFLDGASSQGFLDGMEINTDAFAVTVDGDTANVTGVSLSGAFGLLDLGFDLAKRDGKWLVIAQTQQ